MSLLLDTHALVWWLAGEPMEAAAMARIADRSTLVVVSAASVWEIGIKAAIGKLKLEVEGSLADLIEEEGFEPLPITIAHAGRAGELPPHHRDPFDRMLIAQAQIERLTLVTRDPAFEAYDVDVLAC